MLFFITNGKEQHFIYPHNIYAYTRNSLKRVGFPFQHGSRFWELLSYRIKRTRWKSIRFDACRHVSIWKSQMRYIYLTLWVGWERDYHMHTHHGQLQQLLLSYPSFHLSILSPVLLHLTVAAAAAASAAQKQQPLLGGIVVTRCYRQTSQLSVWLSFFLSSFAPFRA